MSRISALRPKLKPICSLTNALSGSLYHLTVKSFAFDDD